MFKTHFTRKNFIAIAMVFFYGMTALVCALMIDGNNPVFKKNNPVQLMAASMFPLTDLEGRVVKGVPCGSLQAYILVILFIIYLVLCFGSILYEVRLAKYYNEKPTGKKWWLIYIATFFICGALWVGISMVSQISDKPYSYYIMTSFLFLAEALVIGAIFYLAFSMIIMNVCFIVVNFKNINKPFKFFDSTEMDEKEKKEKEEEEKKAIEQGKLAQSFGENGELKDSLVSGISSNSKASLKNDEDASPLKDRERVFPGLCSIDYANMTPTNDMFEDNLSLEEICVQFRNYLAKNQGLYFSLRVIREFVSGMAASHFIILEGLSGTGKSSLARYFSEFISEKSFFEAVQATWRDRTNLIGYYNDFSKTYNETEFLKRLYEAGFHKNHLNVMVLDEMNISRVEYYFADFLSIMEYPVEDWKVKIMQFPYDFEAPEHLADGILTIPENTYFIGTANKDESTFTITDKVYDRAITIDFDERNEAFETDGPSDKITLSLSRLQSLYREAIEKEENRLTNSEYKKFKTLTDFTYEMFDLTFGNRILRQIQLFVPVFVACGGKKEDALDFMFARKVIAKLEGRFEDYIKQGLLDLQSLIYKTYGENSFTETNHLINKFVRKL